MRIYQPMHAFVAAVDGVDYSFTPQTLVEEGHPILRAYPELFVPVHVHLRAPDVEAASAAPGEKRKR
jgi:hypothetical protein